MESNKSYPRDDVEQRRARVEAALRAEPRKSAAEVARDLGVSRDVTQKIRRRIMAGENTRDRRTIVIPEGKLLSELCHEGMQLEESGIAADEAAGKIGINRRVYRAARDIVQLAANPGLGAADKARAMEALAAMDESRRLYAIRESVEDLIVKMWGGKRGAPHNSGRLERIVENYMHAVVVFAEGAQRISTLSVPFLADSDRARARAELKRAKSATEDAIKRLRGV